MSRYIIPAFALAMFLAMVAADRLANSLPPTFDTSEASAAIMRILLIISNL